MQQGQGQRAAGAQQGGGWSSFIFRMLIIYFAFNFFAGNKKAPTDPATGKALPPHRNSWAPGQEIVCYSHSKHEYLWLAGFLYVFF